MIAGLGDRGRRAVMCAYVHCIIRQLNDLDEQVSTKSATIFQQLPNFYTFRGGIYTFFPDGMRSRGFREHCFSGCLWSSDCLSVRLSSVYLSFYLNLPVSLYVFSLMQRER